MRSLHVRCGFKHYILEKNPYIKILKRFKSKTIEISRTIINSMKKKNVKKIISLRKILFYR